MGCGKKKPKKKYSNTNVVCSSELSKYEYELVIED